MNFSKIFLSVFVVAALFSCKKVIEIEETDFIGGDVAYKTVGGNEQGVVGAYALLSTEMDILFNAVMSDEVKKAEFYNSATVHEWQFSTTDVTIRDNYTAFNLYYRVIDRVNRVLAALPTADSIKVGDNALRNRLRGEALFIRAFSHFELYRYYSGATAPNGLALAYMEQPSQAPTARIAVEPFFQKLNADLAEAKSLVVSTIPTSATSLPAQEAIATRANKTAVSGLQARVALYLKEWQNAITYSSEYITAMPLASRANFPLIWTDATLAEVAFKLKRTTAALGSLSIGTTVRMGSLFRATASNATQLGTITWAPSDKLWDMFDKANDIRFTSYLKDEPLLTAANRPSRIVAKYNGTAYNTANENIADAKVFRTGEMYLIRAEARAEVGDLPGATADLNALRAARINGYTAVSFGSATDLIAAVIDERFKELAFEGHRFWDLRRRNLPVTRLVTDAPNASSTTLPAGNFRFVLPIPSVEIQANPFIQQNPGYSN
jgi:hypothetical protein